MDIKTKIYRRIQLLKQELSYMRGQKESIDQEIESLNKLYYEEK